MHQAWSSRVSLATQSTALPDKAEPNGPGQPIQIDEEPKLQAKAISERLSPSRKQMGIETKAQQ